MRKHYMWWAVGWLLQIGVYVGGGSINLFTNFSHLFVDGSLTKYRKSLTLTKAETLPGHWAQMLSIQGHKNLQKNKVFAANVNPLLQPLPLEEFDSLRQLSRVKSSRK